MRSKLGIIKPSRLVSGDRIGVIAPSSPIEQERLKRGLIALNELGFDARVVLEPAAQYGKITHLFGSDSVSNRVHALHGLFRDPAIKMILAVRGAHGAFELLPYLDFGLMAANPKALVGFSDTTCLLLAAYNLTGLVTIHGPSLDSCLAKIGDSAEAGRSFAALIAMLNGTGINPFKGLVLHRLCGESDGVQGPLIGGNLSIIAALMGTPWEPDFDEHILFLEETGEKPYRLDRMLLQLKLAGKLNRLRGVVFGHLTRCGHEGGLGPSATDVIMNVFKDFGFPVLSGAPFGHELLNLPLPIGISARIEGNSLEIVEAADAL